MLRAVCKLGPWSHLFLVLFYFILFRLLVSYSVWFRTSRTYHQNDNNSFFPLRIYSLPNVNKMQIKYNIRSTQWSCAFLVPLFPFLSHSFTLFKYFCFFYICVFLRLLYYIHIYLMRSTCEHSRPYQYAHFHFLEEKKNYSSIEHDVYVCACIQCKCHLVYV